MKMNRVLTFFAGAVLLSACTAELETVYPVNSGDEVVFGAKAAYDLDPRTKTVYGEQHLTGGKGFQDINWVAGDKVFMYCPEGAVKEAEYAVNGIKPNTDAGHEGDAISNDNRAYLVKTGDAGIQWSSASDYNFYGVYPSPASIKNAAVREKVSYERGVLTGYVPVDQTHTITKTATGYEAKPNMDYSYMTCYQKITKAEGAKGVSLKFRPITTAIDVTLTYNPSYGNVGKDMLLSNIMITSDGQPIAGSFTCDLTTLNDPSAYPVCNYPGGQAVNSTISIPMYYNEGDAKKPVVLDASHPSITVTVFLLPHQVQSGLKVTVNTSTDGSRSLSLVDVALSPHKKSLISAQLPKFEHGSNWITPLDDKTYLNQLSIPGTAQSYSYNSTKAKYKTQSATVAEQWNMGIRCFELRGPEPSSGTAAAFGNVALECGRSSAGMGKTFATAVSELVGLLDSDTTAAEFLMIIFSFESNNGHGGIVEFMNGMNAFIKENYAGRAVSYNPNLTIGDVRKKVMFIARITSEEDKAATVASLASPVDGCFVIDQWGSLKDNWARRGYTFADGTVADNWGMLKGTSSSDTYSGYMAATSVESTMIGTSNSFDVSGYPSRKVENQNFEHNVKVASGVQSFTAYVQDWARVSPKASSYYYKGSGSYYFYWPESLTEKQEDIWNTFIKATSSSSESGLSDTFYINSLDGLYVDKSDELSYSPYVDPWSWNDFKSGASTAGVRFVEYSADGHVPTRMGGMTGDIPSYANDINDWFYNKLLEYGEDNISGPTGLILLDYVGANVASTVIPSIIIDNNYKFPLKTQDGTQPSTSNE